MWLNSIFTPSFDSVEEVESLRDLVRDVDKIRHQLNEALNFGSEETQVNLVVALHSRPRYN